MGNANLTPVILIVAESAAVYTAFAFVTLVTYLTKSNIQFVLVDMSNPIIGLVFCLIIVRVTMGMSFRAFDARATIGPSTTEGADTATARSQGAVQLMPIRVNVQKHVEIGDGRDDLAIRSEQKDGELARYSPSLDTSRSQLESS